ncbi:MAG: Flp pilus assembly protein CpaB [Paracoccaceae bacterium]|jgi:pilus assembly protein CpaB
MRAVFALVLVVGVALAGGAVMMAQKYIAAYQNELARERQARQQIVPTTDVYIANRALKYGERLSKEDVRLVKWPQGAIPEGAFTTEDGLFPSDTKDNRVVLRTMEKDEAILVLKVTKPGEDAGITSQLSRGMRAFAIKVDVATGVSGFLRPGDRVDVYWTGRVRKNGDSDRGELTRLIEAGVQLIAIDQKAGSDQEEAVIARTVTVAALPQQVAALAQAQTTGRLSLSLVGATDDTVAEAIEVDQRSLLGLEAIPETVAREEKRVCTIRNRRGAEVIEIPIPCTN